MSHRSNLSKKGVIFTMSAMRILKVLALGLLVAGFSYHPASAAKAKTKARVTAKARSGKAKTKAVAQTEAAPAEAAAATPGEAVPAMATAPVAAGTQSTSSTAVSAEGISEYYGKKFMQGPVSVKKVCLTFDDGPYAKTTPQVLEILKKEGIRATFFMLGESVQKYPDMAKIVAEAGHEIGCHTIGHQDLRRKDEAYIQQEVLGSALLVEKATGKHPHVFRPPFGNFNANVLKYCLEGQMAMVCWSVDTNDWRKKATPESIDAACLRETQGGSVILMHDIHEKGIQALPRVIKELKAKGFEFVTVSDLVAESIKQQPKPGTDAAARQPAAQEDAPVKVKTAKKSRTSSGRK
jgi:peptidoglycan/xylan/chitin deacetylase (PgdA/CDA1 family)